MSKGFGHPKDFIDKKLITPINAYAREAEQLSALHPEQLNVIYTQHWFKMYVPKEYGGLGLSLPEILRIEEALAYADGSVGWVVTLCSGAGWFYGFIDPKIVKDFFDSGKACLAGSGATTGVATIIENGYIIHGCWKYASGCIHANGITVNCRIKKGDEQILNDDGTPKVLSFILKPNEVKINRTWNSMGMIATGSYAFEVNQLFVPRERSFIIDGEHAHYPNIIFKFPFLQLAETTLAVNLSGMAVRFLDLCEILLEQGKKYSTHVGNDVFEEFGNTRLLFDKVREEFYRNADDCWMELNTTGSLDLKKLQKLTDVSYKLVKCSRVAVTKYFPYCGLSAADIRMEINRVWRNFHTAGQHALFNRKPVTSNEPVTDKESQ